MFNVQWVGQLRILQEESYTIDFLSIQIDKYETFSHLDK